MKKKLSPKIKGPQFIRFFRPILEVLRESGGSGTSSEVTDRVIDRLDISDDEQSVILKSGQSRVYNQVHWARLYLVKGGLLDSSMRGVWTVTDLAEEINLETFDAYKLFKSIEIEVRSKKKDKSVSGPDKDLDTQDKNKRDSDEPEENLLDVLKGLSPTGFERICQRLLRENNFEEVTVTGKSSDGGIDGYGILKVNEFVSFTVFFQCKRYQGGVGSAMIRDFRGAMEGRADKGLFLTTGVFTSEAKKEARRDGARPIELVDGETLVQLFQTLELGVKARVTFDIDYAFFDDFRD